MIHQNLTLARELMGDFSDDVCTATVEAGNTNLMSLLGTRNNTDGCLPGNTLSAICTNLQTVITLASEPVDLPFTGIERELRRRQRECWQRERIVLFARVSLALLQPIGDQS
jgi:hypothetical protein